MQEKIEQIAEDLAEVLETLESEKEAEEVEAPKKKRTRKAKPKTEEAEEVEAPKIDKNKNHSDASQIVLTNTSVTSRSFKLGRDYIVLQPNEMRVITSTEEVEAFKKFMRTKFAQDMLDGGFISVRGFTVEKEELVKAETKEAPKELLEAVPAGTSGIVASANTKTEIDENSSDKLKIVEEWVEQPK